MTWMMFLALIAIVALMAAAVVRGVEVDRVAGTRLLASAFFLVLAFVGLGTASFYAPPDGQVPRLLLPEDDFLGGRALGIMGTISGGIGLFLFVLGAVHLAQSQWRSRLDKFDESEMSRLDDLDLNERREDR
jgi:hypothetical protein